MTIARITALAFLCTLPVFAQPSNSPRLFASGVISGAADDLSPAFAPDGKTVYFTRGNASGSMIVESKLVNDQWTAATIAPFSGVWNDLEPAMAPDGAFLVFASNRPAEAGGKPIDGKFNGKVYPAQGGNLWRVNRTANGWSEPRRLPETINADTGTFSPSIAEDGSLYFMRPDRATGRFHLFRAQYMNGAYQAPVAAGIGDASTEDVDPAVAPDESFIVYSTNHPDRKDHKRLAIALRKNGQWQTPVDLGDEVNEQGGNIEARLGPDHVTLYFSTNTVPPVTYPRTPEQARRSLSEAETWANGSENIWYVSLRPWL